MTKNNYLPMGNSSIYITSSAICSALRQGEPSLEGVRQNGGARRDSRHGPGIMAGCISTPAVRRPGKSYDWVYRGVDLISQPVDPTRSGGDSGVAMVVTNSTKQAHSVIRNQNPRQSQIFAGTAAALRIIPSFIHRRPHRPRKLRDLVVHLHRSTLR